MFDNILARISESRYCPNSIFYFHSILGLEFNSFNEKCFARKPDNLTFEKVDQESLDQNQIEFLLNELILVTGVASVVTQREIFTDFFRKGHICFLARLDTSLVGYYWAFQKHHIITYDDYKNKNLEIELTPDMVFFGNGFIHPAYRLKGIFPYFAKFCIEHFPPGSRAITATDFENIQSFNSHRRLGYIHNFKLTCISIWRFQLYLVKTGKNKLMIKYHLSGKQKATPKIDAKMLLPV